MTFDHPTTISKLFHDREQIELASDKLGRALDQLEDEGRIESAEYREVNGYYGDLFERLEALDEAISQAEIFNEGDRFIIAMVAQWRMQEIDHGMSAAMAARLMARLRQ
jgi:hypothetical protein